MEQVLRGKVIFLVKILQCYQGIKEATRESKELRKSKLNPRYVLNFEDIILLEGKNYHNLNFSL